MSMKVSVVVPTYKRPELLQRCLEALLAQDFDPSEFEIIVVDDGASESTRTLVEGYSLPFDMGILSAAREEEPVRDDGSAYHQLRVQQRAQITLQTRVPRVRYLSVEQVHGPAAARNVGWRAAEGEVIAFTDDDCIPQSSWLTFGMAVMDRGYDGVSGQVVVPLSTLPTDYEREQLGLERSEFITANCFYKKLVLEEAGGFDERFRLAWREDSDLYFTLIEKGCRLALSPDPVVYHPVRAVPWGISIRMQKKTLYNALCYSKHPRLYKKKFKLHAPVYYYAILVSLLIMLTGAVLGDMRVILPAIFSYLLLVFGFTVRRLQGTSHARTHVVEMLATSMLIPLLSLYWRVRGAIRFRVLYF